jgi:pimeloyl-ACP methyl ester carboxylesterase
MPVDCEEITLTCKDGLKLAGQRYSSSTITEDGPDYRIMCWHGWLDNCRSFYKLAPGLVEGLLSNNGGTVEVVALDAPGHGQSAHKSLDGPSMLLMDYVYYIYDAMHQLGWQDVPVILIGHSMGAALSLMYAAAFPVHKLVLLDSLGPYPKPATSVVSTLQKHIKARLRGKPASSVYPNLETAIDTRCLTAKSFPGTQSISPEAAKELVERASKPLVEDGKLEFLHDQRLKWSSILFLTQEHVEQMYREVAAACPAKVCLLLGKDGMPFEASQVEGACRLLGCEAQRLAGSHHFHMDPDTSEGVVQAIVEFIKTSNS